MSDAERQARRRRPGLVGDLDHEVRLIQDRIRAGEKVVDVLKQDCRNELLDLLRKTGVISYEMLEAVLTPKTRFRLGNQYNLTAGIILEESGLLERDEQGRRGIIAIDGKFYPIPSLEQIQNKLSIGKLRLIDQLDTPILLVVPFGMDLHDLVARVSEAPGYGILSSQNEPLEINAESSKVLYFADDYSSQTGSPKDAVLSGDSAGNHFPGWQVVVAEGRDELNFEETVFLDDQGEECCLTALGFLRRHRDQGFSGLTVEDWLCLHLHAMRRGLHFDSEGYCWLVESKYPSSPESSAYAFAARYHPVDQRADLFYVRLQDTDQLTGSRPAVRL